MDGKISLKGLRKLIRDFFRTHPMVKTFHWGDLDSFTATPDKRYKAVNVEFINAPVGSKVTTYNLNIVIADLMYMSRPNTEHDAVSDCLEIAQDFTGFMNASEYTFRPGIAQPFREGDGDIQAGIVLSVAIDSLTGANECLIPE